MQKFLRIFIISFLIHSCQKFENIEFMANLPSTLNEVSGNEITTKNNLIWMINDAGNQPKLFGVSEKGEITKEIFINAKNHDWEDITSDGQGNIYIGDFGNNNNKRKNLRILKVNASSLENESADVEIINFEYENQERFPPKKKQFYFDAEAFFYYQNYFYIFTKSRIPNNHGKTLLYKIPSKASSYKAKLIGEFDNGKNFTSWITGADISNDDFFSGKVKKIKLIHQSQKEGICFKDENTLIITDEKGTGYGSNLYKLSLK